MTTSRRDALSGLAGLVGSGALTQWASAQEPARPVSPVNTAILVTEYGARGDGKADDTIAFKKTLKAAGTAGGAIAFVPPGRYRITERLRIPEAVTLEGAQRAAPPLGLKGSVILADVPPGDENGPPFITLSMRGAICGIKITYPQQNDPTDIKPFPWCVRAEGDHASVVNCLLENPYQAVDLGTRSGGRHYVDGLYGQALRRGLYIDNCFDVARVRNVHFWPFWKHEARGFMESKGEAFIIGRTDWQYMEFCFCIWYRIGFHFVSNKNGPGNALLLNSGSDIGPTAVRVDHVQGHSGVSFVNNQFMSGIEVSENNTGPVKFTSCGFWGVNEPNRGLFCGSHATLAGSGGVTFDNCHFTSWDTEHKQLAAIDADSHAVAVRNCDFVEATKKQIRLGPSVKSAIIMGNRLRGGSRIEGVNKDFVIGMNSET
jgi:Pectate lyase superfamily protein